MSVTGTTTELVQKTAAVRPQNQGGPDTGGLSPMGRWIGKAIPSTQRDGTYGHIRKILVVLWAHDYKALPIGKSRSTYVSNGKLIAEMEFAPPGLYPLADQVRGLMDAGILVGASIGMKPIEAVYNAKRDGTDFLKQELLEWSIVSIPANSSALRHRCVGGRCDEQAVRKWLAGTSVKNSSCDVTSFSKPVQGRKHDDDLITFEVDDLKEAIAGVVGETLKREVHRAVLMKTTGRVD